MTNREFFEAVQNGTINADVQAHATAEIDKMNTRNAKKISRDEQRRADAKAGQEAVRSMVERYEANTGPKQVGSVGGVMVKKMHACQKLGVTI